MKSSISLDFGDKIASDFSYDHQCGRQKFEFMPHWHDCFEIFAVDGEPMKVILADGEVEISRGDIAVFVPRALHGIKSLGESYDNHVFGYTEALIYSSEISSINMKYLAPFRYGRVKSFVIKSDEPGAEILRKRLDALAKIYENGDECREMLGRSEILAIHSQLYKLSLPLTAVNAELSEYLVRAESYIRSHVSEDISPHDVANALHLSFSHLARLLKNNLATSAVELINQIKISTAEQMMINNNELSITDIAISLGYSSPSYFTRKFTEIRGQSPTDYRKALKSL
jgi:AraC-like DNA-binding protein